MASTIQIANRALTKLGEQRILSLTDNNNAGRTINSMFDQVRDAELRRNYWNFAIRRTTILALSTAPEWGFSYQYVLPAEFLALVQVNDVYIRSGTKSQGPWRVEGNMILTNIPSPLKVRFVQRIENSGLFDPLFAEALASKLAYECCEALTQTSTKKQMASDEYRAAISEAARCNAIENPPNEFPNGTWLDSRENYEIYNSAASASGYVAAASTIIA